MEGWVSPVNTWLKPIFMEPYVALKLAFLSIRTLIHIGQQKVLAMSLESFDTNVC